MRWAFPVRSASARIRDVDALLFAATIFLFLVTRLWGLERFPIYFFTDEAVQTVSAADFMDHGLRNSLGELVPTYFQNGSWLNLSVSVYAQVVPYMMFGLSEYATRATSVLVASAGTAAVGLMLRDVFRVRFWWAGSLVLVATPVWFLLSRTAFETVIATSFYAWFLYFYARVRTVGPRNLYPALLFGALAFYSYAAMQVVVMATAFGFVVSDAVWYRRNLDVVIRGLLCCALLSIPFLRFSVAHGGEASYHLRAVGSYVTADIGLGEKVREFRHEYALGLNPRYWYARDNGRDLVRDRMKGYGHLLILALPFTILGVVEALRRLRSPPHRIVLVAAAAAPLGGSLVETNIYRNLVLVVPVALFSGIGIALAFTPLVRRVQYQILAAGLFLVPATFTMAMAHDALVNGPTWYRDYGLGGMQFGGRQVRDGVREALEETPQSRILISSTWANGTDVVMRFFLHDDQRARMGTIDEYMIRRQALTRNDLFVMTPSEFNRARRDPRFAEVTVTRTLPYPDGRPGFYFVRLRYSRAASRIFAQEAKQRARLIRESFPLDGETVSVRHSRFDVGRIDDVFDGDDFTLARTLEANPCIVRLTFPRPRVLNSISVTTGTMLSGVSALVTPVGSSRPIMYSKALPQVETDPTLAIPLGRTIRARSIEIRVRDLGRGIPANVHIREIRLK